MSESIGEEAAAPMRAHTRALGYLIDSVRALVRGDVEFAKEKVDRAREYFLNEAADKMNDELKLPHDGIELAAHIAPDHARAMRLMLPQLLIVLIERLGGSIDVPVAEIDNTGDRVMLMHLRDGVFHFENRRKQ